MFFSEKSVLPGKERSLSPFDARVERLLIGDRAERGVSADHLVLPLLASLVHLRRLRSVAVEVSGVYMEGCTWRGVPGVYIDPSSYY